MTQNTGKWIMPTSMRATSTRDTIPTTMHLLRSPASTSPTTQALIRTSTRARTQRGTSILRVLRQTTLAWCMKDLTRSKGTIKETTRSKTPTSLKIWALIKDLNSAIQEVNRVKKTAILSNLGLLGRLNRECRWRRSQGLIIPARQTKRARARTSYCIRTSSRTTLPDSSKVINKVYPKILDQENNRSREIKGRHKVQFLITKTGMLTQNQKDQISTSNKDLAR